MHRFNINDFFHDYFNHLCVYVESIGFFLKKKVQEVQSVYIMYFVKYILVDFVRGHINLRMYTIKYMVYNTKYTEYMHLNISMQKIYKKWHGTKNPQQFSEF